MNQQVANKRIAKNTIALYIRMFVIMAVSLYTSRIILQVLGISDFGLYNVIGGIVASFSMLSAALTVGTQRFLSYAMGEGDEEKLQKTFSIALGLHIFLAIILLILAETIGLWFVYNYLNIPNGRFSAAIWVYQFSVIAFLVNLVQVPFQSCLISHEKMNIYAYMSIYDVVMKLLVLFVIQVIPIDKLILYGLMILIIQVSSVLIYNFYCRKNFEECSWKIKTDKKLTSEMLSYTGWNLFGGSLGFVTGQGINILLNIFCGTTVNAARGLSMNINNIITQFVSNFQTAVNPQIVKQYAAKEYDYLYRLVINNARLAEYLYLLIAIPIFIEIDFLLDLWLVEVPEYTSIFIRIIIIQSALSPIDYPVGMLIHASGKMKWPSIITVIPLYSIFIISYFLLKNGYTPVSVYIVSAVLFIWRNITNMYFANKYSGISISLIIRSIYMNTLLGCVVMFIIPYLISSQISYGWERFIIVSIVSILWSCIIIYFLGLTKNLRILVKNKIRQTLNNIIFK